MAVFKDMFAVLILFGMVFSANGTPVAIASSAAQEQEAFANNLLQCVKEKRSRYNTATQTFSGYDPV